MVYVVVCISIILLFFYIVNPFPNTSHSYHHILLSRIRNTGIPKPGSIISDTGIICASISLNGAQFDLNTFK